MRLSFTLAASCLTCSYWIRQIITVSLFYFLKTIDHLNYVTLIFISILQVFRFKFLKLMKSYSCTPVKYIWDFSLGLTHVILPRLSCEGYILVVLELVHKVVKWCHFSVKVMSSSSCNISAPSGTYEWKCRIQWWTRKQIHYLCEDGIENPSLGITICHHSASLMMPNSDPHNRFYPTLTLMNSYILFPGNQLYTTLDT